MLRRRLSYLGSLHSWLPFGRLRGLGSWEHDLSHEDISGGSFSMVEFCGILC